MNNKFEVMALDADFAIVSLLRYVNLQWTRKFYEAGTFSIQIPLKQYSPSFKYIYTKDRPEVGEISQINFIDNETVNISGFFLEEKLNIRVVYPMPYKTNITNNPDWVVKRGTAEDVALAFFEAFKDVEFTSGDNTTLCELGINSAESQGRGVTVEHTRQGEQLGDKLHEILKPSLMSYRVNYDFVTSEQNIEILQSKDCTQDNTENNNPVIFSTRYGNLRNPNIVLSDTDYKNAYFVSAKYTQSGNDDIIILEANTEKTAADTSDRFLFIQSSDARSNYASEEEYIAALHAASHNEIEKHSITMSFDFDATLGSYIYREDFDIGTRCSIEVSDIGISADAVLIECAEVIKEGTWSMTMDFEV